MTLEIVFVSFYATTVVLSLVSLAQLRSFLGGTPGIADAACLERFKSLVRLQMYYALAGIVLLVSGAVAGAVMILSGGLRDLLVVLAVNAIVLGLGVYHKKVETRVRSLPAGSDELTHEYRRVCTSWVKKALPDF
jgi:hypothetical protein